MQKKLIKIGLATTLLVIAVIASIALIRDTAHQGQDFEVYWGAARRLINGFNIYETNPSDPMVFKYPPWIAPLFLPFALFKLALAKWIWGACGVVSIFSICLWLEKLCKTKTIVISCTLFWGIWAVHQLDGQVSLPMLAVLLWGFTLLTATEKNRMFVLPLVFSTLSIKVFSIVGIFGLEKKYWNIKSIIITLLLLSALSLGALKNTNWNIGQLFQTWAASASSGGRAFPGEKVRKRENQSITAFLLRTIKVSAKHQKTDFLVFLLIFPFFCFLWRKRAKNNTDAEKWVGWLALTTIVHPLSWFHSFVLAFPLATITLQGALDLGLKKWIFISIVGVSFITIITQKTLGGAGHFMELLSIKSWGVIILLYTITEIRKQALKKITLQR